MRYLLNTNVCIGIINGTPPAVVEHFQSAVRFGDQIHVSSISSFELWYGVEKILRRDFNRRQLETFLSGGVISLPFGEADSVRAGEARAILEREGKPIGPFDTLIAGQALFQGLVLVTANAREFSRMRGLVCEDWSV